MINYSFSYLWVACVAMLLSCNSATSTSNDQVMPDAALSKDHIGYKDSSPLDQLYTEQSVVIVNGGTILEGTPSILDYFANNRLIEDSSYTIYSIPANGDSTIIYEMGGFVTVEGKNYKRLIIWHTLNNAKKKVLEYLASVTAGTELDPALDQRRQTWMNLCNQHKVSDLVNQLYHPQAIYYNHKPVVRGTQSITNEYQYMSQQSYHLTLSPLIINPVNEKEVFEIGQCRGSYGGRYILIWLKNEVGIWSLILDSNI